MTLLLAEDVVLGSQKQNFTIVQIAVTKYFMHHMQVFVDGHMKMLKTNCDEIVIDIVKKRRL